MRHRMSGKQLSRTTSHRLALRRNLAQSLFEHGAIRTTEAKAKELRPFVERLITVAKQGTLHARRRVIAELGHDRLAFDKKGEILDETVVQRLFNEIAPRYADRPGGYTRIIRLPKPRLGDAGPVVLLQLVEQTSSSEGRSGGDSRRRRRAAKRRQAAADVAQGPRAEEPSAQQAQGAPEPQAPSDAPEGEQTKEG